MRVQRALTNIGLYSGTIEGVLGDETKTALKRFQVIKSFKADGLMSTETLNALGVAAVQ
jgi:peptidoglycan hydrolase-like protein with peptidoglycan-binding domain